MAQEITFDPARYMTKVLGRDYLEVKWRLVWLRAVHPLARIETELVEHRDNAAVFRATVTLPPEMLYPSDIDSGEIVSQPWVASATGYGMESATDFGDYLEKAETKALGRALAALGFGTQFCGDFEFGADQQRMVDSPVDIRGGARPSSGSTGQEPTERQLKYLHAVAREVGLTHEDLEERCQETVGHGVASLTRREVSQLIERMTAERGTSAIAP